MDLATIARRVGALPEPQGDAPRAAVAAILQDGALGPELLFIERAERAGDPWSGHMALPGGLRSAADASLRETAIRETAEEVGVDLGAHELLGTLGDVPTHKTGLVVRAFVFALRGAVTPTPTGEVAAALWAPIGPMMRGEASASFAFTPEGFDAPLLLPSYRVASPGGERVVWGLTYRMLEMLFEAIR